MGEVCDAALDAGDAGDKFEYAVADHEPFGLDRDGEVEVDQ